MIDYELIDKVQDVVTIFAVPIATYLLCYILIILIRIKKEWSDFYARFK